MNYDQAITLINRLGTFFPQFAGKTGEAKQGYVSKILQLDYARTQKAIENIIDNTPSARGPSIADLLKEVAMTKTSDTYKTYCEICDNTGWTFGKQEIHGKMFEVASDCICTPRLPEYKAGGPAWDETGQPGWIESLRNHDKVERRPLKEIADEEPF